MANMEHPFATRQTTVFSDWSRLFQLLESNGWTGHRLFSFGYIYRRNGDTVVIGNGGIRLNGHHLSPDQLEALCTTMHASCGV